MSVYSSSPLVPLLYGLVVVLAVWSAAGLPERETTLWPVLGLWSVVAVPSLLQLRFPQIYDVLHRDSSRILDGHQYWRPFTSAVVQDGGIAGTTFNLLTLAIVTAVAVRTWGPRTTTTILALALVLLALPVLFRHTEPGGGNSGITFTLAASLAGLAVVTQPGARSGLLTAATALTGAFLLALGDLHGIPVLLGLLLGLAVAAIQRPRRTQPAQAS